RLLHPAPHALCAGIVVGRVRGQPEDELGLAADRERLAQLAPRDGECPRRGAVEQHRVVEVDVGHGRHATTRGYCLVNVKSMAPAPPAPATWTLYVVAAASGVSVYMT